MAKYLTRLDSIAIGEARTAATGMPSTMASIAPGKFVDDSAGFFVDAPTITHTFSETSKNPLFSTVTQEGESRIEFAVHDLSPAWLALGAGGTTNSTTFEASKTASVINQKAIRAIGKDKDGTVRTIDIFNVNLVQSDQLTLSKNRPGQINYIGYVMEPAMPLTQGAWKFY